MRQIKKKAQRMENRISIFQNITNFSKNKKGEIKVQPFINGLQVQTLQLGQLEKTHVP